MTKFSRLKSLLAIPAPLLAAKLAHRLADLAEAPIQRARDRSDCTYGPKEEGRLGRVLLGTDWLPEREPDWLGAAAEAAMRHEFDLLGSGPVRVFYGLSARGFLGHRYQAAVVSLDTSSFPVLSELPNGSRDEARRILSMTEGEYTPLDWQIDFRSGYRWGAGVWYRDCKIGLLPGADIKVPWELGRMQHLPLLALAFAFADGDRRQALWVEFRNQVLDFLASNPPRWGVQWRCPMDVGIRIANVLLARDMFLAAGAEWDNAFEAEICRMARDHAKHIVAHLEWSPAHTGNHYLADVAGLLVSAGYLPAGPETDAWLAFGVQELAHETARQFLPDGGSYEASTSYHRLSGEIVAWASAIVQSLPTERRQALDRYDHRAWRRKPPLKPCARSMDGGLARPVRRSHFEALLRAAKFTSVLTKPDGTTVQIGDSDSGRFVKIEDPNTPCLDHRGFIRSARGVAEAGLAAVEEPSPLAAAIAASLKPPVPGEELPDPARAEPFGEIGLLLELADKALESRRQTYRFELSQGVWEGAEAVAFPDFGVYVLRSPRAFLSFRCGRTDWDGRGGHAHNDALSIELWADGQHLIRDPGSFVYTADIAARNQYRSVAAHFAPQVSGLEPNPLDAGTFLLPDRCKAEALAFGAGGFAGRHFGFGEPVFRVVIPEPNGLQVVDFVDVDGRLVLARIEVEDGRFLGSVPFSPGYGLSEGET